VDLRRSASTSLKPNPLRGVREAITAYDADEATEDELIDHIEASLRPLTELERTDP
jgi:hypothetical protein